MSVSGFFTNHQWTWLDSPVSSKKGWMMRRSGLSLCSNFSAHSGVAGTLTGGTSSPAGPFFPLRAYSIHLLIPHRYVLILLGTWRLRWEDRPKVYLQLQSKSTDP